VFANSCPGAVMYMRSINYKFGFKSNFFVVVRARGRMVMFYLFLFASFRRFMERVLSSWIGWRASCGSFVLYCASYTCCW